MTTLGRASAKFATTRMAAAVLVGGVVAGGLLAMATPTSMKAQTGTWRDMIGVRKVTVEDGTIPIYTAPQDLTPVQWQTAAQEYPVTPQQDHWSDVSNDAVPDMIADAGDDYQPQATVEALPAEMMDARYSRADTPVAEDDAAGATAEAARTAAADVRAQENTAADPEPTQALSPAAPQAATNAS